MKRRFKKLWRKLKPHPMLPMWRRWLQYALIFGLGAGLTGLILVVLTFIVYGFGLPSIDRGEDLLQAQSTVIMDREEEILYAVHGEENRKIVPLYDISNYLVDATIAVEDGEFYDHLGFDLPCYVKAVAHEAFGLGIRRGCSTITQQLVKNIFLNPEQTYKRKIQELILATRVEGKYNKDEILELYLNEIPYGNNAYGAELAARTYFDKSAEELTLTESAIMAGLPKAPTRYSPYGNNRNSHLLVEFTEEQLASRKIKSWEDLNNDEYIRGAIGSAVELADGSSIYISGRVDIVLNAMEELGMITTTQKEDSIAESHVIEFKPYRENIKYPHFVLYVKELIEEKYGKEVLEQGGLRVYTTLDPNMQEIAEESIAKFKERNDTNFDATNASLVAIHPQTGQILSMVGSADYFDEEIDGNVNVSTRYRQPGSSFKPFVYALAFLNGYAPSTVLYDVETQFGPGNYPQNYDGTFMGPVSIRRGLGLSRNIPAIKAYFLSGQETEIIPFMEKFGVGLDENIGYGWPLALGSGEVRLLDMVGAYSVFANQGIKKEISPILKIENREGDILEQWEDNAGVNALDPEVAYLITHILSDPEINVGVRTRIAGQHVAAKTGTSNKKNDRGINVPNNAWMMGYSTKLVAGVWAGNADGSALYHTANGHDTAGPIWNDFMSNALAQLSPEPFPRPPGIIEMSINSETGLIPSEDTPADKIKTEVYASFNVPTEVDSRYLELVVDGFTELIATQYSPAWSLETNQYIDHRSIIPAYSFWQAGIDEWIKETEGIEKPPTEVDEIHTSATFAQKPSIVITSPTNYSEVSNGRTPVTVELEAPNGFEKVEFYLNDQLHFTEVGVPYNGQVRIPVNAAGGKTFNIMAYVYDELGYRTSSTVQVKVEN
jgi:membrane peptidoglycan carboxypeptidase